MTKIISSPTNEFNNCPAEGIGNGQCPNILTWQRRVRAGDDSCNIYIYICGPKMLTNTHQLMFICVRVTSTAAAAAVGTAPG